MPEAPYDAPDRTGDPDGRRLGLSPRPVALTAVRSSFYL